MRRYTLHSAVPSALRLDYDGGLNAEQREVVLAPPGVQLVLAGAGSGKTRALTWRVARLLETGYSPDSLLLLTFTNRAADQMLSRAGQLARCDLTRLWGGTFHHVAHMVLRDHAEAAGFGRDFGILDREDAKELMSACIAACGRSVGQRRFPSADVVCDLVSSAVNLQQPLVDVVARRAPHFTAVEDGVVAVARRFVERKRELNLLDFDDLLLHWKALLVEHPSVARVLQERFRAVLVDEYQDVNRLQADLVDILAAGHGHLMVVGDDAQSIYSFRGSEVETVLRFPERHPGCEIRRLVVNYRSTPQIVALANASIARNTRQFRKELRAVREERSLPAFVTVRDVMQQAEFVAQRLLELRDEGVALRDAAVLYRAHHHSMEVQMELARRGIPFVVRSGLRFFEQAHVKDVLAFLRFADNARDELAFKRLVRLFPGLGSATADAVWDLLEASSKAGRDARQVFAGADLSGVCPPRARAGMRRAQALAASLCDESLRGAPSQMIRVVLDEGSYREHLRSRYPNAREREDDLAQLAEYALQFDSLRELVADVAMAGEIRGEDVVEAPEPDEKVVLSSIHQAKGLEWRAVFVLWLSEGRFPTPQSLRRMEDEEEERRLFHVAATRAKDELYLVHPVFHVERDHTRTILRPSRFLAEVDGREEALMERWSIEEPPGAAGPPLPATPDADATLPPGRMPLLFEPKGQGLRLPPRNDET